MMLTRSVRSQTLPLDVHSTGSSNIESTSFWTIYISSYNGHKLPRAVVAQSASPDVPFAVLFTGPEPTKDPELDVAAGGFSAVAKDPAVARCVGLVY